MSIEIKNLYKSYGSNKVLFDFNYTFEEGKTYSIMGASGQGKTTLLRIMLGLEKPCSGQIFGLSDKRKSVVFQEDRLCENLSAFSNLQIVCPKPLSRDLVIENMARVGLSSNSISQTVRDMSGGQRRRVAILRALFADYDILFMDEPFKGLDNKTKEQVIQFTKEQSIGKTVIFVTHENLECQLMESIQIILNGI